MCSCLAGVVFTLRLTLFVESSADLVPCSLCVGGSEQEGERFFLGGSFKKWAFFWLLYFMSSFKILFEA